MNYKNISKVNQWAGDKKLTVQALAGAIQSRQNIWGIGRITRGQMAELRCILAARQNGTFVYQEEIQPDVKIEIAYWPASWDEDWTVYNNDIIASDTE